MKRTKNNWLDQGTSSVAFASGLRFFEGEDLHFQQRKQVFQETQRQWLEEQMKEKALQREKEREANRAYDQQAIQIDRMRGMLQDQLTKTIRNQHVDIVQANQAMSQLESTMFKSCSLFINTWFEYLKTKMTEHDEYLTEENEQLGVDLSKFILFRG